MTPQSPRPAAKEAIVLDDVIQRIDESLPVIHKMCRVLKRQKKSPTEHLTPERAEQVKQAFEELAGDPLLTDSGDDIREGPSRKGEAHKNGNWFAAAG